MAGTSGDFAKVAINGYDIGGQSDSIQFQQAYGQNKVLPQNVGMVQYAPGLPKPGLNLAGYAQRGQGAITAVNLLNPQSIGSATDLEFITLIELGFKNTPTQGDVCIAFDGTLMPFKRDQSPKDIQRWSAAFKPRGVRIPAFPILMADVSQKNSFTSAFYDDGAESVGTTYGGVLIFECTTPTGVAATGTITFTTNPSDGDTLTVNGATVYTYKTALTGAANQILIGATSAITAQNTFQALMNSAVGLTNAVYTAGTTAAPSTVIVNVPVANVITLTYATTGTAGNGFTLARTGTNITVPATLTGGVAGETMTSGVIQSATSSGGSYTTFGTLTSDMTTRKAEILTIAAGVTINRFLKLIITMSGSTQTWAARVAFGRFFANQA